MPGGGALTNQNGATGSGNWIDRSLFATRVLADACWRCAVLLLTGQRIPNYQSLSVGFGVVATVSLNVDTASTYLSFSGLTLEPGASGVYGFTGLENNSAQAILDSDTTKNVNATVYGLNEGLTFDSNNHVAQEVGVAWPLWGFGITGTFWSGRLR